MLLLSAFQFSLSSASFVLLHINGTIYYLGSVTIVKGRFFLFFSLAADSSQCLLVGQFSCILPIPGPCFLTLVFLEYSIIILLSVITAGFPPYVFKSHMRGVRGLNSALILISVTLKSINLLEFSWRDHQVTHLRTF